MWITCSSRTSDKGRGFASRVWTAGRTILIGVTSYILIAASYLAFVPTARPQLPSSNGDHGSRSPPQLSRNRERRDHLRSGPGDRDARGCETIVVVTVTHDR